MDLCAIHLKNANPGNPPASAALLWKRNLIPERPNSCKISKFGVFQIRVSRICLPSSVHRSFTVKSMAKNNNHDNSSSPSSSSGRTESKVMASCFMCHDDPLACWQYSFDLVNALAATFENMVYRKGFSGTEGNGDQSIPDRDNSRTNNSSDSNKSDDDASQKSHDVNTNWREFRAMLYNNYQVEKTDTDVHKQGGTPHVSKPLGQKWAHPLSVPETGCVLLATEKLDGVRSFERTVVLLLRSGTRHPQEGPFGVVINRPLHKKIKHMKPTNNELATTFADCSLHFGGPLEASVFLLRGGTKSKLPGFEEVIPGLCFGARNSLEEAAELVKRGRLKSQDFKFFVGYAGWQLDQLREEIESDYWHVAACSPSLIFGDSSDTWSGSLWKEILQEMGGHYSELSRKPKQDI